MPDLTDEQPWPDVLEQRTVISEDESESEDALSTLGGAEADPADVLDQRRVVSFPDDERAD